MARARNLKPGFFKNEDLAECSAWARLCFAGLWTLADREGRLEDRPKWIKGELFPFDSFDVDPLLFELEGFGFITRYKADGRRFIQVTEFKKHQSPHYSEKPSVIKPPPLPESLPLEASSRATSRSPPGISEAHADGIDTPLSTPDSVTTPGKDAPSRGGRNLLTSSSLNPSSPTPSSPNPSGESVSALAREAPAETEGTRYGAITREIRRAGIGNVNPDHLRFRTLVDAGATAAEFLASAPKALQIAGDRFAYLLAIVEGERKRAASTAGEIHRGPMPGTPSATVPSDAAERTAEYLREQSRSPEEKARADEARKRAMAAIGRA